MKSKLVKSLILTIALTTSISAANAESLFTLGASQTYAPAPKSLYGGVQARGVGDLISIIMTESIKSADNISYKSAKVSSTTDNFSNFINNALGRNLVNNALNGFGGANSVTNSGAGSRAFTYTDNIAVQVVQQMPNGNLVVQGKKTVVNGSERLDLLVTGVVDPRWINQSGQVYSYNVSNLQFAVTGRGSISRSENEGIINRFVKYLF